MKPLEGIIVLDFSQFLAGPFSAMRLADLGAKVIKVERSGTGDLSRQLTLKNIKIDGDSSVFHSMNRNKASYSVDLKNKDDLKKVLRLIAQVDVMIENFRPGTMKRLELDYETIKVINPGIVYGSISGYGSDGPWKDKPGQDLLVQALSGMPWLNGNAGQPPMPLGLAVVDMFASASLVEGILALLVRRGKTRQGGLVEVSLLESALDFQFEVLTTFLNDGGELPERSKVNNAHAYLSAPYGIYETKDGFLALAMGSVIQLGELLDCPALARFQNSASWFTQRDEIKAILTGHLKTATTGEWLSRLEPADYWCAEVLNIQQLFKHEGFKNLDMIQTVRRKNGTEVQTTRCPIRIDGKKLFSVQGAPVLGEDNSWIQHQFFLNDDALIQGGDRFDQTLA